MTSQRFFSTLAFLDSLDKRLGLQSKLDAVSSALEQLVGSPAQPQFQTNLASALTAFEQAAQELDKSITPSQDGIIKAMGGGEFFDSSMAENVKTSIQKNAMTPSVARDFVKDLASRRAVFMQTVRNAKQALEHLKVTATPLEPGTADIAFLIPRDIFDNELARFAKELTFISRLIQDFSEALTGQAEQPKLEQLSSSTPTVSLEASLAVIKVIGVVVSLFLAAWAKIVKIRKMRTELSEMGMKGAALNELNEHVETTVNEVIEESTELVLVNYSGGSDRKNELDTAIRKDLRRLFGQIERGLTIEFRAEPQKGGESEQQKVLTDISNLGRTIQFPQVSPEPMLLKGDEVIEGEIAVVKQTKKTTTQKTTAEKKGPLKAGASDSSD